MEDQDFEITKSANSSVQITGTLKKDSISKHINAAAEDMQKGDTFKGFRPGMASFEIVQQKYGSMAIWTNAAKLTLSHLLPVFFAKNKITPLDQPKINLTSVVDEGEIKFTVDINTAPNIELAEIEMLLKNVTKSKEDHSVTVEEVEEVISDVKAGVFRSVHPGEDVPKELPDLSVEDIGKIYPSAKDINDFKDKIRSGIVEEKKRMDVLKNRNNILEKLLENFDFVPPEDLVDREAENGWMMFQENAKRLGTTVESFLSEKNVAEVQMKEDIRKEAVKRSKIQIMLNIIAGEKGIMPDVRIVEKEVERIRMNKKDLNEEHIRVYVQSALTNEETVKYLESLIGNSD